MNNQDEAIIRGILQILAGYTTATIYDISLTQHVSRITAIRVVGMLKDAGVVERTTDPVTGSWKLTKAALEGRIHLDPEALAHGRRITIQPNNTEE